MSNGPAKIIKRMSRSTYVIQINNTTKLAHLRQLNKTRAKTIEEWPGIFEHKHREQQNNKRPRSSSFDANDSIVEIRRS